MPIANLTTLLNRKDRTEAGISHNNQILLSMSHKGGRAPIRLLLKTLHLNLAVSTAASEWELITVVPKRGLVISLENKHYEFNSAEKSCSLVKA